MIKPQAAIVIPVFIAWAFTIPARRAHANHRNRRRNSARACRFGAPRRAVPPDGESGRSTDLVACNSFAFGSSQYPDNTVNAFNLWAIKGLMWQKDSEPLFWYRSILGHRACDCSLGADCCGATSLTARRARCSKPAHSRSLAFFILATRMHERYSLRCFLFVIACVPIARRYCGARSRSASCSLPISSIRSSI